MEPDDASLLLSFIRGSEEAFSLVVERHLPMVYGAALRQLAGDSGLAAEVAQSVFNYVRAEIALSKLNQAP